MRSSCTVRLGSIVGALAVAATALGGAACGKVDTDSKTAPAETGGEGGAGGSVTPPPPSSSSPTGGAGGSVEPPPSCAAPTALCGDVCVLLATDEAHCGACDAPCPSGQSCVGGSCEGTGCPGGRTDCGGLCVDTLTNPMSCGACNAPCGSFESCEGGACVCSTGYEFCDGACVDVLYSMEHCGTCGNACAVDEQCVEGVCEPLCASPYIYCDGGCYDPSYDGYACGGCGNVCGANEVCNGGQCECAPPFAVCGGACVDLQTTPEHCGACDVACSAATRCEAGACTACQPNFFYCPSETGDPLTTCLSQAQSASPDFDATLDAPGQPSPHLVCQCNNCLAELADCVADERCAATWVCTENNGCTDQCWGASDLCPAGGYMCFKWCSGVEGTPETLTRLDALLRCTRDNGCGVLP